MILGRRGPNPAGVDHRRLFFLGKNMEGYQKELFELFLDTVTNNTNLEYKNWKEEQEKVWRGCLRANGIREWTPKHGDMVFVHFDDAPNCVQVYKYKQPNQSENGLHVLISQHGDEHNFYMDRIKMFDPDKWGKPWSEI